jgi:hypothetical protein
MSAASRVFDGAKKSPHRDFSDTKKVAEPKEREEAAVRREAARLRDWGNNEVP